MASKLEQTLRGVLLPYSMEPKADYFTRVERNAEMRELFPNPTERIRLARQAFLAKWQEAPVTVTKLDGTMFFID